MEEVRPRKPSKSYYVAVSPRKLYYYMQSPSSHTQVLRLYNPHDIPLKYKVKLNNAAIEKYSIVEAKGVISAASRVDVMFKHIRPHPINCNVTDLIKIVFYNAATSEQLTVQDVTSCLLPGSEKESSRGDITQTGGFRKQSEKDSDELNTEPRLHQFTCTVPLLVKLLVAAVCMGLLSLPSSFGSEATQPEPPGFFSIHYIHKIYIGVLLGMFIMMLVNHQ